MNKTLTQRVSLNVCAFKLKIERVIVDIDALFLAFADAMCWDLFQIEERTYGLIFF